MLLPDEETRKTEAAIRDLLLSGAPNMCVNCINHKDRHTDEGLCLFGPRTFKAMTSDEFMDYLGKPVARFKR